MRNHARLVVLAAVVAGCPMGPSLEEESEIRVSTDLPAGSLTTGSLIVVLGSQVFTEVTFTSSELPVTVRLTLPVGSDYGSRIVSIVARAQLANGSEVSQSALVLRAQMPPLVELSLASPCSAVVCEYGETCKQGGCRSAWLGGAPRFDAGVTPSGGGAAGAANGDAGFSGAGGVGDTGGAGSGGPLGGNDAGPLDALPRPPDAGSSDDTSGLRSVAFNPPPASCVPATAVCGTSQVEKGSRPGTAALTMNGSGAWDPGGLSDFALFPSVQVSGEFRIEGQLSSSSALRTGIAVRTDAHLPDASMVFLYLEQGIGSERHVGLARRRSSKDSGTFVSLDLVKPRPDWQWLRLERSGTRLVAFVSIDSQEWLSLPVPDDTEVARTPRAYVGFVLMNQEKAIRSGAHFDNISVLSEQ